jgi:hypothetical protein
VPGTAQSILVLANPRSRIRFSGSFAARRSLRESIGVGVIVVRDATLGATSSKCVPAHRALSDASVSRGVVCGARHCSCRDVAARRRRVSPGIGCDACVFTFARERVARAWRRGCGRQGTGLALRCTPPCEVSGRPAAKSGCTRVPRVRAWAITCALRHPRVSAGIGCVVSSDWAPSRSANKDMRQAACQKCWCVLESSSGHAAAYAWC